MKYRFVELNRRFPLKIYLFLILLTILTNIAVQPYMLTLQAKTINDVRLLELAWSLLLNTLIYSVFAGIGLYLVTRLGLGLPFLEGLFPEGERWKKFVKVAILSFLIGVVAVILVLGVDQLIFKNLVINDVISQGLDLESRQSIQPAWWQSLLASFYGGITEEIQLRLFLLTLIAWVASRIWRDGEGRPKLGALWVGTILSSLVFGLGHLPTLNASLGAMGLSLTPILILSTITTNSIGGIVFGWLYWSRGLESAMIGHFTADIVLHIILPALLG